MPQIIYCEKYFIPKINLKENIVATLIYFHNNPYETPCTNTKIQYIKKIILKSNKKIIILKKNSSKTKLLEIEMVMKGREMKRIEEGHIRNTSPKKRELNCQFPMSFLLLLQKYFRKVNVPQLLFQKPFTGTHIIRHKSHISEEC